MKRRLTPADLDAMISSHEFLRPENSTLTICVMQLTNGCTLTGQSNVINPDNYDKELGEQAAYNDAKSKIWELEGYALKRSVLDLSERAARAAHEANRILCQMMGDHSHLPWDFAPDWQKDSAVVGAMNILQNPNATPEDSHESWMKHKLDEGWVWGPVKDVEKKEHPCLVPYDQLPSDQKVKDAMFTEIVKAVLA